MWGVFIADTEDVHVMPIDDIENHIESVDCHCEPRYEFHDPHLLVTHEAFDQRP